MTQKFIQFFGIIIGVLAAWYNDLHVTLQVLIVVMFLDLLLSFVLSVIDKTLSSRSEHKSGLRKIGMWVVILLVSWLSKLAAFDFPVVEALAGFYIYTESISVLENAAALGVPIPQFIRDALEKLSGKPQAARN